MSDIVTSRVFTDGERGITAQKLNDIVGSSVIQPAFYSSKPTAPTADPADIALILKAGAYAQVPVSTLGGSVTQAQIWSTRLRSFNAIGNPNFEVDQRNAGNAVSNPVSGAFPIDRWSAGKAGSMAMNLQQSAGGAVVPGTSFVISAKSMGILLSAQQLTLGAGDLWDLNQVIEGCVARELFSDVSSISLLVASSVAGLKFSVAIRDGVTATKSLVKLCTVPSASTPTLIQLPNLPVFPSGNFSIAPGTASYQLTIALACGSTYLAPAADVWQNGNFIGAPGMDNFAAKPVNSTFNIYVVQHEPGAVCSVLMDKPFIQNLDECLRYYQKTYSYDVKPGTVDANGSLYFTELGSQHCYGSISYKKVMARRATAIVGYSPITGAGGYIRDAGTATDRNVTSIFGYGDSGFGGFVLSTQNAASTIYNAHYTVDTGW